MILGFLIILHWVIEKVHCVDKNHSFLFFENKRRPRINIAFEQLLYFEVLGIKHRHFANSSSFGMPGSARVKL